MSDRQSVRAELVRKQQQLAQMRLERERRSRMLQDENINPSNLDGQEKFEDADAVLRALGLSASLSRASTAPSNVSSLDQSASRLLQSPDPNTSKQTSQHAITPQQSSQSFSLNDNLLANQQSTPRTSTPLEVVHVNQINIPPKERVYYTKSTQTPVPASVLNQEDPTQGAEAPQQKSYYGKQSSSTSHAHHSAIGQSHNANAPHSPSVSLSSNNTQEAGNNQLTLEWDDEFPGTSRLDHIDFIYQ